MGGEKTTIEISGTWFYQRVEKQIFGRFTHSHWRYVYHPERKWRKANDKLIQHLWGMNSRPTKYVGKMLGRLQFQQTRFLSCVWIQTETRVCEAMSIYPKDQLARKIHSIYQAIFLTCWYQSLLFNHIIIIQMIEFLEMEYTRMGNFNVPMAVHMHNTIPCSMGIMGRTKVKFKLSIGKKVPALRLR